MVSAVMKGNEATFSLCGTCGHRDCPGPFHGAEIAFTFDNAQLCDHYSEGSADAIVLSRQVSAAWVSFARAGNPNHADLSNWPKYTSEQRATMQFDRIFVGSFSRA